jgi:hypothetical protein
MLSRKDEHLRIEPGFSRWLAACLLSLHTAALGLVAVLPLALSIRIPCMLLVSISLWYYWRHNLVHRAITRVEWSGEGGWRILRADGVMQQASLRPASFLHRHLVILELKTADPGVRRVLLPGDSIPPDMHRRLRTLLKLENHFGE